MEKRNIKLYSVLNIISFLGMVMVNALANILPINGKNTGELSDHYPNLFVPAGITFSIWGVIYLLLLIFNIYQFVAAKNEDPARFKFIQNISLIFFLSCILNGTWIFAWHYQQVDISLLIMVMLLISLIMIYRVLGIGKSGAGKAERYLVHLPFSIYLGWISVATIANVTAALVDAGWGRWGMSEEFWTMAMLFAGTILAIIMAFMRRDIFYGLVIIWAYSGILIKHIITLPPSPLLTNTAFAFVGLITIVLAVQLIRRKVY
jgi:hypothetical protein